MSLPALRALRSRYPKAQIHLMVNSPYAKMISFLNGADQIIEFDRKDIQDSLLSADRPVFESYDMFKEFIGRMNENKYDLVINLTQNKLSGYMASMIHASDHIGLAVNSKDQATFGSPWFKYLNDVASSGADTIFHYADIFYFGVGGVKSHQDWSIPESHEGAEELEGFYRQNGFTSGPKVVLQALTSDEKKNWQSSYWLETVRQIKISVPTSEFVFLCAPSERKPIESLASQLKAMGLKCGVAELSLAGAYSLLSNADLLITGDTSIKHLAYSTRIKILEIALGSSDKRKTGAYKSGSVILSSKVECHPCEHSKPCFRDKQYCSLQISPELVALTARSLLLNDLKGLKILAEEYEDEAHIHIAQNSKLGFWYTLSMNKNNQLSDLNAQLEKLAWFFLLEKEHLKSLAVFGSESNRLSEELLNVYNDDLGAILEKMIVQIETRTQNFEGRIEKIINQVDKEIRNTNLTGDFLNESLKLEIINLEKDLKLGQFLSEKINLSDSLGIYKARQLHNTLSDTFHLQKIKLKLIRDLKSQFKDKL